MEAALFVVSGKWKPLILFHLSMGARRYGELRRMVGGVSDKVLIQQLKELQADGAVMRVDHGEIPPKVEYSLTGFGASIVTALSPLCEWGGRHLNEIETIANGRQRLREAQAA
ncbi:helix-turn-helix transcriptional regulator [Sphingomonas nostoxanthinifaciens]|nr:helix-turn-helix transcriptional regulator [Sphingomonas nostoxanthinifaciens]